MNSALCKEAISETKLDSSARIRNMTTYQSNTLKNSPMETKINWYQEIFQKIKVKDITFVKISDSTAALQIDLSF